MGINSAIKGYSTQQPFPRGVKNGARSRLAVGHRRGTVKFVGGFFVGWTKFDYHHKDLINCNSGEEGILDGERVECVYNLEQILVRSIKKITGWTKFECL